MLHASMLDVFSKMNTKSQDTYSFILTLPGASGQWIGHVNTTASYCVHILNEALAVCAHPRPLLRACFAQVSSGKKMLLLFKEDECPGI